jgi:hypothetical protein
VRRALRVLGLVAGIFVIAAAVGVVLIQREWHRASYFTDARLVEPNLRIPEWGEAHQQRVDQCERLLLKNHGIVPGSAIILARRDYNLDLEHLGMTDSDTTDRLTISIESPEFDRAIALPSPDVRVYYSSGPGGFILTCGGMFTDSASGRITLRRGWFGRIRADLDLSLEPRPARRDLTPERVRLRTTVTLVPGNHVSGDRPIVPFARE